MLFLGITTVLMRMQPHLLPARTMHKFSIMVVGEEGGDQGLMERGHMVEVGGVTALSVEVWAEIAIIAIRGMEDSVVGVARVGIIP